ERDHFRPLVDPDVRGRRGLAAAGEPVGDDPILYAPALGRAMPAEVDVVAIEGDDRLAGGLMQPSGWRTSGASEHRGNLQTGRLPALEPSVPLCRASGT